MGLEPIPLEIDGTITLSLSAGNTVTALWNYAQHFAMSDNFHSSNIDPSLPGAINLVTGQTLGAVLSNVSLNITHDNHDLTYHQAVNGNSIGEVDSNYDDCSSSQQKTISMIGKNIGNLMDEKGTTWGWFEGGFKPTHTLHETHKNAVCGTSHLNIAGKNVTDYVVYHEPFQYYQSTANLGSCSSK
ncbi:MAG TPA: alkaline phosphatase family protein [Candidatus Bathyarchaeia archaeon]|nr:alkaline phosphatase family protein [Candidatus Bathyarchaeia archaeon]